MEKILCAGWKQSSCDDGPGIRSVLFFQGCKMRCPGCQNSSTHNHQNGIFKTVQEVSDYIIKNCRNKKITISGGEPLEQLFPLTLLLKQLHELGFNICLYTGWDYSLVPVEIHHYLNYLKCGHFDIEKTTSSLMYIGSSNQKMFRNVKGIMTEMNLEISEGCY